MVPLGIYRAATAVVVYHFPAHRGLALLALLLPGGPKPSSGARIWGKGGIGFGTGLGRGGLVKGGGWCKEMSS